jgi:hypothetical protein
MLRVTIEVVPFGNESKAKVIDTMTIVNDLSHPKRPEYGNYTATMSDNGGERETQVIGHCREDGPWELVRLALNADW